MRHLMICISGWAGTGKDECAGRLVKVHKALHTGLADPGKRHMKDAYGFTDEQLWGPSKFRNAGDIRYPKPIFFRVGLKPWEGPLPDDVVDVTDSSGKSYLGDRTGKFWFSDCQERSVTSTAFEGKPYQPTKLGNANHFVRETDPDFWLSPREALQKYLELMNTLYADTWIRKGIEIHRQLASGRFTYTKEGGIVPMHPGPYGDMHPAVLVTCYSDFRHIHEHRNAKEAGDGTLVPVLVRIKRPTVTKAPFKHRSETEQTRIRDAAYDFVIDNSKTLDDLYGMVDDIVKTCSNKKWHGKAWSPDFVLPEEQETYVP